MKPGKPEQAYFAEKAGSAEVSSLSGLLDTPIPLMLAYAGLDPADFIAQTQLLNQALCKRKRYPHLVVLPGHSHMSEVYAVNTSDKSLSAPLMAFVKSGVAR